MSSNFVAETGKLPRRECRRTRAHWVEWSRAGFPRPCLVLALHAAQRARRRQQPSVPMKAYSFLACAVASAPNASPDGWCDRLKAAGLDPKHDPYCLRHSFATSLLCGWWGDDPWSLEAIGKAMGHAPGSKVTSRYSRIADTVLAVRRFRPPCGRQVSG